MHSLVVMTFSTDSRKTFGLFFLIKDFKENLFRIHSSSETNRLLPSTPGMYPHVAALVEAAKDRIAKEYPNMLMDQKGPQLWDTKCQLSFRVHIDLGSQLQI